MDLNIPAFGAIKNIYDVGTQPQLFCLWPFERLLWLDWHGQEVGSHSLVGRGNCQRMMGNKDIFECKLLKDRKKWGKGLRRKSVPVPYADVGITYIFKMSFNTMFSFSLFLFIFFSVGIVIALSFSGWLIILSQPKRAKGQNPLNIWTNRKAGGRQCVKGYGICRMLFQQADEVFPWNIILFLCQHWWNQSSGYFNPRPKLVIEICVI